MLAVAVAAAVPIYRDWYSLKRRVLWLYWSHQCAVHRMPDNVEVVVRDAERAKQLLAANPDYVAAGTPSAPTALYCPQAWRMLRDFDGRCLWLGDGMVRRRGPIAFMGLLRRPDGGSRLVVVTGGETNALDLLLNTDVLVLSRPGLFETLPPAVAGDPHDFYGMWEPAQINGGIADPLDPSHVTFTFAVYASFVGETLVMNLYTGPIAGTGVIDGYLQNDDSMTFKLREVPKQTELGRMIELGHARISGVIPQRAIDRASKWRR